MKDKHKVSERLDLFREMFFWKMKETQENVSFAVNICFTRFRASEEVLFEFCFVKLQIL